VNERCKELRAMKTLGDGFMLCYADAAEAVSALARIISGMRASGGPSAHASVHRGVVIARDGDYFGSAVNVAARLLAAAGQHQLVATAQVVRATAANATWQSGGLVRVRGVAEPVETFYLAGPELGA
jgi:adenylate cyclase